MTKSWQTDAHVKAQYTEQSKLPINLVDNNTYLVRLQRDELKAFTETTTVALLKEAAESLVKTKGHDTLSRRQITAAESELAHVFEELAEKEVHLKEYTC